MPGQVEMTAELSVVEMTEKRLTIDIKPPKGKKWKVPDTTEEEDEEEYDPPSSADIEVVHKHPPPDLHSILKQRSTSESSEEISNGDPDSPRSESEELCSAFSKKRSVSFSNHVDQASFKSSASVSSMTPGLKSKRRRQRKREEKKKGRVRCNSEGTSSSEECLHSVSDSYSHSEEEGESGNRKSKSGRKAVLVRAVSDPGPNIDSLSTITGREKGSGEPGKQASRKNKRCGKNMLIPKSYEDHNFGNNKLDCGEGVNVSGGEGKMDSQGEHVGIDLEVQLDVNKGRDEVKQTKENKENPDNEGVKNKDKNLKIISEIKDRLAEENVAGKNGQKEDSDDDDFVDAVSNLVEEFKAKSCCSEPSNGANDVESESCHKPYSKDKPCLIEEVDPVCMSGPASAIEHSPHSDGSRDDASGRIVKEHEKSGVEKVLSWEEGPVSGEHVTNCAFQFSNSLMFDLDIE